MRRWAVTSLTSCCALSPNLPDARLQDALSDLVHSELVFCRGTPPNSVYTFKHALVQDAAYATMLRSRRAQLHARIVTTLESQFPEIAATQLEVLAHHCTEAGLTERALEYWAKAGQHAVMRSAMTEAETLLRKGLVLLDGLPDTDWRRDRELELQIGLAQALTATQGYGAPAVYEAYARARQLCEQHDRPDKLLSVLLGQWNYHAHNNEAHSMRQLAADICRLSETQEDNITRYIGCWASWWPCLVLGDFVGAEIHFEQGFRSLRCYQRAVVCGAHAHHRRVRFFADRLGIRIGLLRQDRSGAVAS